ncbi:hypothetical protein F0562_023691 [Nyssa sinensis]|uniref:Uncharacterized protein n=1 Tax=Nyssa sinensis TaxID=561372 RepID=A0A5J5BIF8_9ASTE|nr:hypothetical protein F0562_023691 [Nyssa sinensis]
MAAEKQSTVAKPRNLIRNKGGLGAKEGHMQKACQKGDSDHLPAQSTGPMRRGHMAEEDKGRNLNWRLREMGQQVPSLSYNVEGYDLYGSNNTVSTKTIRRASPRQEDHDARYGLNYEWCRPIRMAIRHFKKSNPHWDGMDHNSFMGSKKMGLFSQNQSTVQIQVQIDPIEESYMAKIKEAQRVAQSTGPKLVLHGEDSCQGKYSKGKENSSGRVGGDREIA